MQLDLTPKQEHVLQQLLQSGRYHSAGEVIDDALTLLESRERSDCGGPEELTIHSIEDLQQKLQAGLDSGPATPMTEADWQDHRHKLQEHLAGRKPSA